MLFFFFIILVFILYFDEREQVFASNEAHDTMPKMSLYPKTLQLHTLFRLTRFQNNFFQA